jgi:3-hydroxyacyl-[acyl-carrier-protein] dehydratase
MILTQNAIKDLLPHRAPFLFVDEILSADIDCVIGTQTFDKEDERLIDITFPVPFPIILESMAQCGGAGIRSIGKTEGLFALVNVDFANFLLPVFFGELVTYEVKNVRISDKMLKQSGKAFVNDKLVLEAAWMCVKISSL